MNEMDLDIARAKVAEVKLMDTVHAALFTPYAATILTSDGET